MATIIEDVETAIDLMAHLYLITSHNNNICEERVKMSHPDLDGALNFCSYPLPKRGHACVYVRVAVRVPVCISSQCL